MKWLDSLLGRATSSHGESNSQKVVHAEDVQDLLNQQGPLKLNVSKECEKLENLLQKCVSSRKGLSGCQNQMEKYKDCLEKDMHLLYVKQDPFKDIEQKKSL